MSRGELQLGSDERRILATGEGQVEGLTHAQDPERILLSYLESNTLEIIRGWLFPYLATQATNKPTSRLL